MSQERHLWPSDFSEKTLFKWPGGVEEGQSESKRWNSSFLLKRLTLYLAFIFTYSDTFTMITNKAIKKNI